MAALHEVGRRRGHIVAQVVEAKLVVRTESDISEVGLTASLGVGLMLVDTVYRETVEHVKRPHPLGVTLGQIVVHGNHMHAVSGESIKEYGQRSHEGLTFTRCHLGNLTLMEYHTTEELHIVVYHVPHRIVATGFPVVSIDGLVALDAHEILRGSQCAVHIGSRHHYLTVLREAACGLLHDGEGLGQHLVECHLVLVEHGGLQLVYLVEELFALLNLGFFYLGFQLGYLGILLCSRLSDAFLQLLCLSTELIVRQCLYCGISLLDLLHPRLNLTHITRILVSEQLTYKFIKSHIFVFILFS